MTLSRTAPGLPSAHPWRRLMGMTYEAIVLFGVLWFFDYAYSALTRFEGEPGLLRHGFQLFTGLVLCIYFSSFWANGRRTLPMKTLSLQLVDRVGKPLSVARSAARFLSALLMLILVLAIAWANSWGWLVLLLVPTGWSLVDPDRQSLYDRIAGTRLVRTPD